MTSAACYAVAISSPTHRQRRHRRGDGEIVTAIGGNSVYVHTSNSSGTLADLPFHLIVTC